MVLLSLWISQDPLILASKSRIRSELLKQAGFDFSTRTKDIDERDLERRMSLTQSSASDHAKTLAEAKALAVSAEVPDAWVIGADQILEAHGKIIHKPKTRTEAEDHLNRLAGVTHQLHSAVAITKDNRCQALFVESAVMKMRALTADEIRIYCDLAGNALFHSVGSYEYEGLGRHLFESALASHDVILGLPLDPIIKFFRSAKCLRI